MRPYYKAHSEQGCTLRLKAKGRCKNYHECAQNKPGEEPIMLVTVYFLNGDITRDDVKRIMTEGLSHKMP